MVSYEGLADEYLWVPQSKCCSKPEKVQNILIHPVSVHGKTAADERGVSVGSANAVSICSAVAKAGSVTKSVDFSGKGHVGKDTCLSVFLLVIFLHHQFNMPSNPLCPDFWYHKKKGTTCTQYNFFLYEYNLDIQQNFISICIYLKYLGLYLHICLLTCTYSIAKTFNSA